MKIALKDARPLGLEAFVINVGLRSPTSFVQSTCERCSVIPLRRARRKATGVYAQAGGPENGINRNIKKSMQEKEDARVRALVRDVEQFEGSAEEKVVQTVSVLNEVSRYPDDVTITAVYNALMDAGRLPGFGYQRGADGKPNLRDKAVIASELPKRTGMPLAALTPRRGSGPALQLGLLAAIWGAAYLTRSLNASYIIQPIVYATGMLVAADQLLLRGAVFDQIYAKVNPSYARRVVAHEAGHFFVAYMHGLPVQRYALSAWDAISNRVPGQAATLFADDELATQLQSGKLTNSTVNRYSVVAMAGLAAEGMMFGEATGGDADVTSLVRLLAGLKPAWDPQSIRIQARWAVVQAVSLIRDQRKAYEALRDAMEQRMPLGDCITRLENALHLDKLGKTRVVTDADDDNDLVDDLVKSSNVKLVPNDDGVAMGNSDSGYGYQADTTDLDEREKKINAEMEQVERRVRELRKDGINDIENN